VYEYIARFVEVVDGDTVDLDIDLGFKVKTEQRIRVAIVDAPEKKEPGWLEACEFIAQWFKANPICVIKTFPDKKGKEKSGGFDRWLAECYDASGQALSKALLDSGNATIYKRG
jgi:micrococcal nuclease